MGFDKKLFFMLFAGIAIIFFITIFNAIPKPSVGKTTFEDKIIEEQCPVLSQPSPDWCSDGKIISGGKDAKGCELPPTCEKCGNGVCDEEEDYSLCAEDCKEEMVVKLSSSSYLQGEKVQIEIRNMYNYSILVMGVRACFGNVFRIERKNGDFWKEELQNCGSCTTILSSKIDAKLTKVYEWSQNAYYDVTCKPKQVSPGTYRIKILYKKDSTYALEPTYTIYSKEFEIK